MLKMFDKISRIIIMVAVMLEICILGSCSFTAHRMAIFDREALNDEQRVNITMEQTFNAIKNRDAEILKELFSQSSLNEVDDFDRDAERLFNFIKGDLKSYETRNGQYTSSSRNNGHEIEEINSACNIYTTEGIYYVGFRDRFIDTKNVNNIGLFCLIIADVEDHDKIFDPENRMYYEYDDKGEVVQLPHVGIYIPIE